MDLEPFEKLIITQMNVRNHARVIFVRTERDGSKTYMIEKLRLDFLPSRSGSKIMRITSRDIERKEVHIEKHVV